METAKNLRIVYMGTPEFAVASLAALVDGGYNVVGVVTTVDKPAGRGRKLSESAVKQYVNSLPNPPVLLQPDKLRDEQWLGDLKSLNADLFIVVAFRMLPEIVWQMPVLGTFNLHSSLLPLYRGAAPINWAIINGDTKTGVTTFFLNAEIDKGAIIGQREVEITPADCAGTLHDKLMAVGADLVLDSVEKIAHNAVEPLPQRDVADALRSVAPKIFKDDCRIDWNCDGVTICNRIRGLSPYPAAWSDFDGGAAANAPLTAKILAAHTEICGTDDVDGIDGVNDVDGVACGACDSDFKHYYRVRCADGWVYIDTIHPAGKRPMPIADFLRGTRGVF